MAKCFVVLWIPTVNHISIPFEKPYHNGELTLNISDIENMPFPIRIKANEKDIEIFVSKKDCPKDFELFLTLKYEDSSHNGMIKYSFEEKFLGNGDFGFSKENFPEAVYHMIKSLYHVHEFHEDESDSSLQPYVNDEDVNIRTPDNAALRHYLTNHERTVLGLVNSAKKFLRHVIDLEKRCPNTTIKEYEAFPNMYVMALGYDAYIRSLYNSVYNRECHTTNEEKKQLRRRAFNIENSIRYFNVLYVFFDTKIRKAHNLSILKKAEKNLQTSLYNIEETRKAAKSSTRLAIISIVLSFFIGIFSIFYSIKLSKDSSRELLETRIQLEKTITKSVKENEGRFDAAIKIMRSYQDTIRHDQEPKTSRKF